MNLDEAKREYNSKRTKATKKKASIILMKLDAEQDKKNNS